MKIRLIKFFHSVKIDRTEVLFIDSLDGKFEVTLDGGVVKVTDTNNNTTFTNFNNVIWFTQLE